MVRVRVWRANSVRTIADSIAKKQARTHMNHAVKQISGIISLKDLCQHVLDEFKEEDMEELRRA